MAQFTATLRRIVESGYDLGLDQYPIFDESYRQSLNDKIIEHYYFREIGLETAGLFKRFLNRKMNEIMPYYNQMYISTLIKFDPLATKSITETLNRLQNASANTNTSSTGSNSAQKVYSETPQGLLSKTDLDDDLYATTVDQDKSNGSADSSAESVNNANEDMTRTQTGFEGIASELLIKYRQSFVNIDIMVIDELSDLFMKVW